VIEGAGEGEGSADPDALGLAFVAVKFDGRG